MIVHDLTLLERRENATNTGWNPEGYQENGTVSPSSELMRNHLGLHRHGIYNLISTKLIASQQTN